MIDLKDILPFVNFLLGGGAVIAFVRTRPALKKIANERVVTDAAAAANLRDEYAKQYKDTRQELHALRNEVQAHQGELRAADLKSMRRGDKLNMVLFILRMVMDELASINSDNKVLVQARKLLDGVGNEPHEDGQSNALNAAENTVDAAKEAVREVKATEAKSS